MLPINFGKDQRGRKGKDKICSQCGKHYIDYKYDKKRKFCSLSCYWKSEQFNKMIRENGLKCKNRVCYWGKKIAESKIGISRMDMRGKNNWNWKGGRTKARSKDMQSIKYKEWRRKVFERDNYTCQECGQKGGYLQADHLKSYANYPELRYDVNNGRTLCLKCHIKTFSYPIKWNNSEYSINALAKLLDRSRSYVYTHYIQI